MTATKIIISLILLFAGLSVAAGCATVPFMDSCDKCPFDSTGKMDEQCWKEFESQGQTCLATSYPMMATKYAFGACPQLDECVSRLEACKQAMGKGSDKEDCSDIFMFDCFVKADKCAEAANEVCANGRTEEEAGFNNESAGGPIKEPKPEITYKPPEPELSKDPLLNFACGGPTFVLAALFLLSAYYSRNN